MAVERTEQNRDASSSLAPGRKPSGRANGPHGASWLIVTTKVGHIKIGWRKRVINIDWSKTTNKTPGDELFKEEETTKGGGYEDNKCYVHAWSLEKAKEYLKKIVG